MKPVLISVVISCLGFPTLLAAFDTPPFSPSPLPESKTYSQPPSPESRTPTSTLTLKSKGIRSASELPVVDVPTLPEEPASTTEADIKENEIPREPQTTIIQTDRDPAALLPKSPSLTRKDTMPARITAPPTHIPPIPESRMPKSKTETVSSPIPSPSPPPETSIESSPSELVPTHSELTPTSSAWDSEGERLTLHLVRVAVGVAIRSIATILGKTLVLPEPSGEYITLWVKDMPWQQVIHMILKSTSYGWRMENNTLIVEPKDAVNASHAQRAPRIWREFTLRHITAKIAKHTLDPLLTTEGSSAGGHHNHFVVHAYPETQETVARLLASMDHEEPRIVIEALGAEMTPTTARALGIWVPGNIPQMMVLPDTSSEQSFWERIAVLENLGKVKVFASPQIVTTNRKRSSVTQTDTFFFPTRKETAICTTALDLYPRIIDATTVELRMDVSHGTPFVTSGTLQAVQNAHTHSTLTLKIGEVVAVGWFGTGPQTLRTPPTHMRLIFLSPKIIQP